MKKNNLALIISAITVLILGIIILLTAYTLQGADIVKWLTGKWGMTVMICIILYLIVVGIILIKERINRL